MESTRRSRQIVGIITVALVCLSFTAAPASATLDRAGFEPGNEVRVSSMERVTEAVSLIQDSFSAFMQKLGAIFAGQSGSSILD